MGIRYTHFYDGFRDLLDSLMHESDETQRLSNINQLNKDATSLILKARDEAAYELRTRFAGADAEAISGVARPTLDYWASRHKDRLGLPPLKRIERVDLTNVIDLSNGAASHQSSSPRSSESVPSSER